MADVLAKLRARRDARIEAVKANLPTTRTCEGCDTCCTAVGVHEIAKPAAEPCRHLCGEPGASCGIYRRRPRTCAEFFCVWRASDHILPPDARPMDSGWVMSMNDVETFPTVVTLHPDPARPDAWDTPRNRRLFSLIADRWNCLVAVGQGKLAFEVFAPRGLTFNKDSAPELFFNGGDQIGAPNLMFHHDRRRPADRIRHANARADFRIAWT